MLKEINFIALAMVETDSQERCWDLVSLPPRITRAYSAELENSVPSHNTSGAQQKVSILPKTFPLNNPPLCRVLHFH